MDDLLKQYRFKKSEFDTLSFDDEKILYGRLKMLEDLALYIDQLRESYTRHLVVNGAQDCETEEDLKKRWESDDEMTQHEAEEFSNIQDDWNDKKTETIEDELLDTKVV